MSFLKLALPLSVAGLLAGFAASLLMTPRYIATAVLAVNSPRPPELVRDSIAKVKTDEELSEIVQASREQAHIPIEQAIALARDAIQITWDNSDSNTLSLIQIRTTYRTQRGAMEMANSVISHLIGNATLHGRDSMAIALEARDRAFQARIRQMKIRLAALEAPTPVQPAEEQKAITMPGFATRFEPLDLPTVPQKPEFPNRWAFILPGGMLGLSLAIPLSKRSEIHVK